MVGQPVSPHDHRDNNGIAAGILTLVVIVIALAIAYWHMAITVVVVLLSVVVVMVVRRMQQEAALEAAERRAREIAARSADPDPATAELRKQVEQAKLRNQIAALDREFYRGQATEG